MRELSEKMKGIILVLLFMGLQTVALGSDQFEEEYLAFRGERMDVSTFGQNERKDLANISALWDMVLDSDRVEDIERAKSFLKDNNLSFLVPRHLLRVQVLRNHLGLESVSDEIKKLQTSSWGELDFLTYHSLETQYKSLQDFLPSFTESKDNKLERSTREFFRESKSLDQWTGDEISSLVNYTPSWSRSNRNYKDGVKLYMFCRHSREYPCLLLMKDKDGAWVRNSDGSFWSQTKLGLSRHGLPADQFNGHTPQGVYTLDSVMPEANRQIVFGKYRRVIVNFVEKYRNDSLLTSLFPSDLQDRAWWKEGVVARDLGRSLLRIHGTGLINTDPATSYYPFVPTSGCIASKENDYDGVSYHDQRGILDQMMISMGLNATYANEKRIKGLFYVVNIDNKAAPVALADIKSHL